MRRILIAGFVLLFVVGLGLVPPASAQTKEDTLVYSLQSDIDNWDPPNSVLRETIILGYHVFDHLAARDLKTGKVGPNLAISWKAIDDTTWEVKLRQGVKFHDGTPFTAKDVKATLRPRAEPREEADRAGQPRQDQERRGRGRLHGPLQDRRALPALRGAAHRPGHAVREGDQGEGPRVDAGEPDRHRALQAGQVEPEAGAPAGAQRRLLGAQAGLQVRARPHHPRAGHPDRRADLGRRGHHQGGPARPDGRHQQVGPGAHRDVADPAHGHAPARPGRAQRARTPSPDKRVRQAANLAVDIDSHHQARAQRPRRPHGHRHQPDGLRLRPEPQALQAGPRRGQEAPRRGRLPERRRGRLPAGPPIVEPGVIQQTNDAIVADLAKAGIRTRSATGRRQRSLREPDQRQQGRPDVRVVVGLLLGLRRRRDPLRRDDVRRAVQLLLQQGARRPDHPGPLHARRQEAGRDLREGPEAPLRRRGLPLQVGAARRVGHQQPGRLRGARATRSTGCSS